MFQGLAVFILMVSYGIWRMPRVGVPAAVVVTLLFWESGLSLMMAIVATGVVWVSILILAAAMFYSLAKWGTR